MCGACGNYSAKDWSWPWLAGSRSAALIARTAERISHVRGVRVLPAPNGWQVLMPTGSTHIVQSVTALARLARADPTAAPEVLMTGSDETFLLDRRRAITVRTALPDELSSAVASIWPADLMSSGTAIVTIDGSTSERMLRELDDLACMASQAPFRDHIRMLPINTAVVSRSGTHRWANLPAEIGSGDLPALCLGVAARLAALPGTDKNFREARARCGDNGMVLIQSVGPTVSAMEVRPGGL